MDRARKLVEHDKVDVIMGCVRSDAAEALEGYIKPLGIPYLNFVTHHKSLIEQPNVVSWCGIHEPYSYVLAKYAYQELGHRTVSMLTPDYVGGKMVAKGFKDGFLAAGGKIVQEQMLPMSVLGTMDFSAYISKIMKADFVAFWVAGTIAPFVRQYYAYGLKMPLVITTAWTASEEIMVDIGDLGLGMYTIQQYTPLIDTDINKKFVAMYEKKYATPPQLFAGYALGAASIFLKAVENTRGDVAPEKLLKALTNVSVDTAAGHAEVRYPDGIGEADAYITKSIKIGNRYCWQPVKKIPGVGRPYPGY